MNPDKASTGGPSEDSQCRRPQPVKSRKSPLKENLGQKSQYGTQNEAELLWRGERGCSPPTSRALPSSPEIPLWNPWFPGPQVTITALTLRSTGKGRLKQGTYSWSLSGAVVPAPKTTYSCFWSLLIANHSSQHQLAIFSKTGISSVGHSP